MAKDIPFDEDMMTLIMGIGDPEKPGQHGRTMIPAPDQDAIGVISQIRDLCEDFLKSAGKDEDGKEGKGPKPKRPDDGDMEPQEDEEE